MNKKQLKLFIILYAASIALMASAIFLIGSQIANGDTIPVLEQWLATSSPSTSITQRVYGRPIQITGLSDGCLGLTGKLITSTGSACGSGGGSASTDKFATSSDLTGIYPNTATKLGIGTTSPWTTLSINTASTSSTSLPASFVIGSSTLAVSSQFIVKAGNTGVPVVGIGTSSPNVIGLSVSGSGYYTGSLGIGTKDTIGGSGIQIVGGISSSNGKFVVNTDGSINTTIGFNVDGSGNLSASAGSFSSLHSSFNTLDDGSGNASFLGNIAVNSAIVTGGLGNTIADSNGILYYPIGPDPITDNQNNLIISSDAFQGLKLASTGTVMIDTQGNYYGASSGLVIIDPSGDASFAFVDSSFGFRVAGGLALISSDGSASFLGGEFALDAQGYHTSESYYRGNGNLLADNLGNTYYGTGQIMSSGNDLNFYGNFTRNGDIIADSSSILYTPTGLKDNSGKMGTTGQFLSSTGTGTVWASSTVSVTTASISGAIVGIGCDTADTTGLSGIGSTTGFSTTPKTFPGAGVYFYTMGLTATSIRTYVCSGVTVTPTASTYIVKIQK